MAFEDNDLAMFEKKQILWNLYYEFPHNVQNATEKAIWFLNCGNSDEVDQPRVYSFAKDASMVFSAFKQVHNIDLETVDLHWWKFHALFMDVLGNQDTQFGSLVYLRLRIKKGKATKEEREAAREMGALFDVPELDDRNLDEKEAFADFERKFEEARLRREAMNNGG